MLLFRRSTCIPPAPQMPSRLLQQAWRSLQRGHSLQVLTDQSFAASASTCAVLVRAPNCPSLLTRMPATQAFGAQKECVLPTLMAAIAIDVISRLIVEKQET